MDRRPDHIDPEWLELEFVVPREFAGWRADLFISNRIPRLSRNRVQRILKASAFDASGKPLRPNRRLNEGEHVFIYREPPEEPDVPRHFDVLYEDEWLLAVDKPAGLPVHPTARFHHNTLTGLLKQRYGTENTPRLSHRLDSETSGVLLCTKTKDAETAIKTMFAERQVQKSYIAVVFGVPSPATGRVEVPLGFDLASAVRVKMAARDDGLPALTEYSTLAATEHRALLECRPRTGRQHQIRAHLAHIGHPIVGDKMYGFDSSVFLDYLDSGLTDEIVRRTGHSRQALHAQALSLVHPMTNLELTIRAETPEEFHALLNPL